MANRGFYRLGKIRGKKRAKLALYAKVLRDGLEECGIAPGQEPYFNKCIRTRFGNLAIEGPFGRVKIEVSKFIPEGTAYVSGGLVDWLPDKNGQFFGIDRGGRTKSSAGSTMTPSSAVLGS